MPKARVAAREIIQHRPTSIGASVIDEKNFPVADYTASPPPVLQVVS
jgi:hypothetical protein